LRVASRSGHLAPALAWTLATATSSAIALSTANFELGADRHDRVLLRWQLVEYPFSTSSAART
jgi:hypothetical protein